MTKSQKKMIQVQNKFPKKIIFFSQHATTTGTTNIRCCNPIEHFKHLNISSKVEIIYKSFPRKSLNLIILHRVKMNNYVFRFIKYVKMLNIPLVYDIDDLLFDNIYDERINKKESRKYLATIKECDFVTVSTNFLKEKISPHNSNTFLIRNTLSDNFFFESTVNYTSEKKDDGKIVLAYLSGSKSHDADFNVIENTLLNILEKYDFVQLLIVGDLDYNHSMFQKFINRIEHRDKIKYSEYHNVFKEIDINLVPLELNDFCHGKSELKYIEAGASGIPSVLSATKTHEQVIINEENGFLCYNDDDWLKNISSLIENKDLRIKIGKAARIDVEKNYTSKARSSDWNILLKDIFQKKYSDQPASITKLLICQILLRVFIARRRLKIGIIKVVKNLNHSF